MADLTPRQIVSELDRYIVGQDAAKRAVAVAIRNRWRRQQLPAELRKDVTPKNIIMIGPTGVGKTEIARRLAQLVGAPFLKVEATKYTEVGYHGRDVESMIRDLTEIAIGMVRQEQRGRVETQAKERVTERLLDLLLPQVEHLGPGKPGGERTPPAHPREDEGPPGSRRAGRPAGRAERRAEGRAGADLLQPRHGADGRRFPEHVRAHHAQAGPEPADPAQGGAARPARTGNRGADRPPGGRRKRRSSWSRTRA